jgi:hypothetical protein
MRRCAAQQAPNSSKTAGPRNSLVDQQISRQTAGPRPATSPIRNNRCPAGSYSDPPEASLPVFGGLD